MQFYDPWFVCVEQILILGHDVVVIERHGYARTFEQRVIVGREHVLPGQVQQLAMQRRGLVGQIRDFTP